MTSNSSQKRKNKIIPITGPLKAPRSTAAHEVSESKASSLGQEASFISSYLENYNLQDTKKLLKTVIEFRESIEPKPEIHPDEELNENWRKGAYPYKNRLSRNNYEKQKYKLQVELLKLQAWVKENKQRVVILFEGRDAAGKGGTIKRFMEHLNPRGARVVALEKPSETERGQWYFQRYIAHLPNA
jgi:polyphosphate kinase 2 (PPK2 family)